MSNITPTHLAKIEVEYIKSFERSEMLSFGEDVIPDLISAIRTAWKERDESQMMVKSLQKALIDIGSKIDNFTNKEFDDDHDYSNQASTVLDNIDDICRDAIMPMPIEKIDNG